MLTGQKLSPIEKELRALARKELSIERAAAKAVTPNWKKELESKVPEKALSGLVSAFSRGFSLFFKHGSKLLEATYNSEELRRAHRDLSSETAGSPKLKGLQRLKWSSLTAQLGNLTITTIEGVGLGALGIGLPDVIVFLGVLFRGIYEEALRYGYEYDTPQERLLILKMIETALSKGDDRVRLNAEVECLLVSEHVPTDEEIKIQIRNTSRALAVDMLLVKFIQGLPVVGMLGGAVNPYYYNKVLQYVHLKYLKRYLRSIARQRRARLR